ncbi:Gfo/Idh/MocA family oxidoreductase [Phytohabitans sp. ZYX-F-186]|uniref:Gfo/Idh/MocA family oxidoreductase n=1 Tax=Phytohabitans maris TaxID=3071409 RepID=A0ABU0ZVJ8_9ACTN|nr:Gfo/Idh/MocA family oxidoreductase [Phytohabitans sp. ZYX-F-186]MDQ7910344.1 Gfo/Idh/MocA family oxidoreductase [Phytohabitans sp. ZYX-F-186]
MTGGAVRQVSVGVIGTGWCGGIRAETCAASPYVSSLHIAEIRPERLAEVAAAVSPASATADYKQWLDQVDAVMISATPETTHYPMARDCLAAGKHVLLEKPLALTLDEADELVALAARQDLKFAVGYSQRFNPKQAYVKQCVADGTLGAPVSAMVSRHITRNLGRKIGGRIRLSPAAMEATHDIDFLMWCLRPARPVRVYAQEVRRVMAGSHDVPDCTWITITFDSGVVAVVGAGWILPPGYPNFSTTTIELVGADAALLVDDSHRDIVLNRMDGGVVFPLSTMPGERVGHVYAGPMAGETDHFLAAVARDTPVLVPAGEAREVMQVYLAADESAQTGAPVALDPSWRPSETAGTV